MSRHRVLDNGDVVFPKRGKPPPDVAGYTRDAGDPYLFHADFVPCRHRVTLAVVLPCGKLSCSWFCQERGITVNAHTCEVCPVEPK